MAGFSIIIKTKSFDGKSYHCMAGHYHDFAQEFQLNRFTIEALGLEFSNRCRYDFARPSLGLGITYCFIMHIAYEIECYCK